MKPISRSAECIAPSATLAIANMAKQMRSGGIDVIGFGAGEPDFNTPDYIKKAAHKAIDDNQTRYTPAAGMLPLRQAISQSILKETGVSYEPGQICVSNGAKTVLYIIFSALLNPGDEVILPAPYWVTYAEAVRLCGGVPVVVETDETTGFKMSGQMLQAAITEKTKCVLFNNPSNPTGVVYSRREMEELATVICRNDLYVISDEIYSYLLYQGSFTSMAALSPEMQERTILVNGVSKTYAMTGWRIGYCACEPHLAKVISNLASHMTGNACTVAQCAALAAYLEDETSAAEMKAAFAERRAYFMERLKKIEGVSAIEPEGAFYVFMNIKQQIGRTLMGKKISSSTDFAESLLKNHLVAVVPGSAFGAEGYVRWSYATDMDSIRKGLDRLEMFLRNEPYKA